MSITIGPVRPRNPIFLAPMSGVTDEAFRTTAHEHGAGLVVSDKAQRVASFQKNTVRAFVELIAAAGLERPDDLRPWHILRRVTPTEVKHYGEMHEYVAPGALLQEPLLAWPLPPRAWPRSRCFPRGRAPSASAAGAGARE